MSYTYKYNFISPEVYYARVKEELRSYFDSGVVDDLMFPTWTSEAVNRIGKSAYKISHTLLKIEDFRAELPKGVYRVREAYSCHDTNNVVVNNPVSTYIQKSYLTNQNLTYDMCRGCVPDCVTIVEKISGQTLYTFKITTLMKPGNLQTRAMCTGICNRGISVNVFDIQDGVFITQFREGIVYLSYYDDSVDDNFNTMVPDFHEFSEYLKNYLKFKCFETIFNNNTDETFNQVQAKLAYYEKKYDESFIVVKTEIMKKTPYQAVQDVTNKTYRRFWELEM